jgi:hypothetical protein
LHYQIDRQPQPRPLRQLTEPVAGVLHCLSRGPTGQEQDASRPGASPGAHQPVVEAEEIKSLTTLGQVHDPGLGRFGLQAQLSQQDRQPP